MRALPYFLGAVATVAVGGAVAGGAIDTTPRQIFDSAPPLPKSSIAFEGANAGRGAGANHYPIEAGGETYDVAQLSDRGLFSQDRFASARYDPAFDEPGEEFDFAAADADQRAWEGEQLALADRGVAVGQSRDVQVRVSRPAQRRALELERPAKVAKAPSGRSASGGIEYVSKPVVQDTAGMAR